MSVRLNVPAIKKLLAEKSLTASALARLSGVSRNSISTILNRGTCSAVNAGKLAKALDVDIEAIWRED